MTAFDKAWSVVKEDDLPMPKEVPFKMRSREDNPCEHNFEITDERETDKGVLFRTLTCSKCKESHTSSPS